MADAKKFIALSMVPQLANEVARQIDSGTGQGSPFQNPGEGAKYTEVGRFFYALDTNGEIRMYKRVDESPGFVDMGDNYAPASVEDLNYIGFYKFKNEGGDVTEELARMLQEAKSGDVINPSGNGYVTDISIIGKQGVTLAPKGIITVKGDIEISNSDNFTLGGGFIGNRQPVATVVAIDTTAKTITVDNASDMLIGSDVAICGLSPFIWFKARVSIDTTPVGNTFNYTLNTAIGGSDTLVDVGDQIRVMDTTDKTVRGAITIRDSDYVTVDGYFERDVILHNCRHSTMKFTGQYAQPSLEFCSDVNVEIDSIDSLFYGFGSFKTRRITGRVKSLGANFGGAVIKNNYDSHFDSIFCEYSLIYGIQVRDDDGVNDPSTVNPDLQHTRLDSNGTSIGAVRLWRCGRGLFLDGITRKFSCPVVDVNETVGQGASLMFTPAGAFDVDLPRVVIRKHGQMLDKIGYFRSNADIRLQQASDIKITANIYDSLHTGYVFTNNAAAGLCDRVKIDLTLDNCLSGIDISGSGKDYEIKARGRNPAADDSISLINITGPGNDIKILESVAEVPTNGNKFQHHVRIFSVSTVGFTGLCSVQGVDSRQGSVAGADIFVEAGNSTLGSLGTVYIMRNMLLGGGLYGVSLRYVDKVYVYDNVNSGHTSADYHTLNFTPSSYRIEGQEIQASYTIDWPSVPAGGTHVSTAQSAPGFFSDSVVTGVQYRGNSNGIMFSAYLANTNQIYIRLFNPTDAAIDLASAQTRVTFKPVYRPY